MKPATPAAASRAAQASMTSVPRTHHASKNPQAERTARYWNRMKPTMKPIAATREF